MGSIEESRRNTAAEFRDRAHGHAGRFLDALLPFVVVGGLGSISEFYIVTSLLHDIPEIVSEGMDAWDYARIAVGGALVPFIYVVTMNLVWPMRHYRDDMQTSQDWSDRADNAKKLGL